MKKLLSVILVVTMLFAVMAPAAIAAEEKVFESGMTPIIYIRGNGEQIYEADGVTPIVATFDDLMDDSGKEEGEDDGLSKDVIVETAVNILKPFILEGMLFDKWDNYGRAIYEELKPLFPDAALDYDGELFVNCDSISVNAKSLLALFTLIGRKNVKLVAPDHHSPAKFAEMVKKLD